jgi:hypothetical protein
MIDQDIGLGINDNVNLFNLDDTFLLKHTPNDFVVTEMIALNSPLDDEYKATNSYTYCKLWKICGL